MIAMVARATSAALTPSMEKACSRCLSPPTSKHKPMMPFKMIITAANTVSRASADAAEPPASMSETINATSISVTDKASTRVPKGSPTRWATTSAWCTAAKTLAATPSAIKMTYEPPRPMAAPA
jgi:hypothetical protein